MNWQVFRRRLHEAVEACERLGAKDTRLSIEAPATEAEVESVERVLGRRLPISLRQALLQFSRRVDVCSFLDEAARPPIPGVFRGDCQWSLDRLPSLEKDRHAWVRTCFPDASNPAQRVWHDSLSVIPVGNGDYLALDLTVGGEPLVFLGHDGPSIHGWRLGDSFTDYLDRSSRLGFVGTEDFQTAPFLVNATDGLQTESPNANQWRRWFGLTAPGSSDQAGDARGWTRT